MEEFMYFINNLNTIISMRKAIVWVVVITLIISVVGT